MIAQIFTKLHMKLSTPLLKRRVVSWLAKPTVVGTPQDGVVYVMLDVPINRTVLAMYANDAPAIFLDPRTAHAPPTLRELVQQGGVSVVPVGVLWGRAPEKESSLFRLALASDRDSTVRQATKMALFGRNSLVEFYAPISLDDLAMDADALAKYLVQILLGHKATVVGPDLSDRRHIASTILQDAQVVQAMQNEVRQKSLTHAQVEATVRRYVDNIASDYSYNIIRAFDIFLTKLWTRLYDGVCVKGLEQVRALTKTHQVVYVPCHRSHIDYLLLSYIVNRQGMRIPQIAAGDNLNIPIVGNWLRGAGAFFLRRSFRGNALYTACFSAYFKSLIARGAPLEYFIEGGRTRTGKLLAPKLGMLSMTLTHAPYAQKPLIFVPTYIGYERIIEGKTYTKELAGKPKQAESLLGLIKAAKSLRQHFGQVQLSFGAPIEVADGMDATSLGKQILVHINDAVQVGAVALFALAILPSQGMTKSELFARMALYQAIHKGMPYSAQSGVIDATGDKILQVAMAVGFASVDGEQVTAQHGDELLYAKNNALHIYILPALLAYLAQATKDLSLAQLHAKAQALFLPLAEEWFIGSGDIERTIVLLQDLQVLDSQGLGAHPQALALAELGESIVNPYLKSLDNPTTAPKDIARALSITGYIKKINGEFVRTPLGDSAWALF